MTLPRQKAADPGRTEDRPIGAEGERSLKAQIADLTVPQRVDLAMMGNREVRQILSRDANSTVAQAVLKSAKLSEQDILSYAASTQTHEEVLRGIAENRQWIANRMVVTALVYNPRTPPPAALRFLRTFQVNELRVLSNNRSLSAVVRQEARRLLAQKH